MKERVFILLLLQAALLQYHSAVAFTPSSSLASSRTRRFLPSSRLHSSKESSTNKDTIVEELITNIRPENSAPIDAIIPPEVRPSVNRTPTNKRKLELAWCNHDACYEAIREKVVGEHNHMELTGPATGQVAYSWEKYSIESGSSPSAAAAVNIASPPAVLMLVKRDEDELLKVAVDAIEQLNKLGVQVLVDSTLRGELEDCENIDVESEMIRLFDPRPVPGFGSGEQLQTETESSTLNGNENGQQDTAADLFDVDLVVTLGGDGLLMYAAHVFSGPVPPILPVAGEFLE